MDIDNCFNICISIIHILVFLFFGPPLPPPPPPKKKKKKKDKKTKRQKNKGGRLSGSTVLSYYMFYWFYCFDLCFCICYSAIPNICPLSHMFPCCFICIKRPSLIHMIHHILHILHVLIIFLVLIKVCIFLTQYFQISFHWNSHL